MVFATVLRRVSTMDRRRVWWCGGAMARAHMTLRLVLQVPGASQPATSAPDTRQLYRRRLLFAFLEHRVLRSITFGAMWDDEDNNPYGSFARHDSNPNEVPGLASPGACKPCGKHARVSRQA